MSTWFFPSALVQGRIAHNVRVQSQNGVITAVTVGAEPHRHTFDGVAVPGFANTHSHVSVSYTHLTLPTIYSV